MSTELKARMQHFIDEVWNRGNVAALDAICTPNMVLLQPPYPPIEGLEAYRKYVVDTRAIFPDLHMTVEEMIVEGDSVALRGFWTGTQTGPLRWTSLPATGKKVKVAFCELIHMSGDKANEGFGYHDNLGMLRLLGIG